MRAYELNQLKIIAAITAEMHRQCPNIPADNRMNVIIQAVDLICAEYAREPVAIAPSMGLAAWLRSDEVGASSEYMAWVLSEGDLAIWGQRYPDNNHPHDIEDFGRCVGMIEAAPHLAANIILLMNGHGEHWNRIATNWDLWSQLYKSGDLRTLYLRMKNCLPG